MTDSPERRAQMQRLLKELWEIENELGITDDQITMTDGEESEDGDQK